MEELGQFLQELIDRDPKSLSIVLEAHNFDFDGKPTVDLLIEGYKRDGASFLDDVSVMMDPDLLHAEGGTLVSKLTSLFQKAEPYLGAAKTVAGAISNKGGATPAGSGAAPAPTPDAPGINTKKIVIISAIIVVVLVVTLIVIKKLKKS